MRTTNFIEISNHNRSLSVGQCRQFYESAESYIKNGKIDKVLSRKILEQTDSVLVKFLTAGVNLEFLWQINHEKQRVELSKNDSKQEWQNHLSFTDYIFFDSFILQSISFIDHIKGLILISLGVTRKWRNNQDFLNILSKMENMKAEQLSKLIIGIYSEGSWASELNAIKNQIAHNNIFRTESQYKPMIYNKEYQRYCQDAENNMFEFLQKIQEKLFDISWISGKY